MFAFKLAAKSSFQRGICVVPLYACAAGRKSLLYFAGLKHIIADDTSNWLNLFSNTGF